MAPIDNLINIPSRSLLKKMESLPLHKTKYLYISLPIDLKIIMRQKYRSVALYFALQIFLTK